MSVSVRKRGKTRDVEEWDVERKEKQHTAPNPTTQPPD